MLLEYRMFFSGNCPRNRVGNSQPGFTGSEACVKRSSDQQVKHLSIHENYIWLIVGYKGVVTTVAQAHLTSLPIEAESWPHSCG